MKKLKSLKFWFAFISLALVGYIVILDRSSFANLAMALVTPIITYMWANVRQDEVFNQFKKDK